MDKGDLKALAVTAGIFVGSVLASEKSGLTRAFVETGDTVKKIYHAAHEQYPLVVWRDYGDPDVNQEFGRMVSRVVYDVQFGLLGLLAVGMGLDELKERRERYRAAV